MRRGGTVRGIAAGFLGLVALHALAEKGGSGRVADAFGDVAGLVERVMDPNVPAIRDRRAGASKTEAKAAKAESKAAAGVTAGKAKGGASTGTHDRITDRLPIPDPPK